MKQPTEQQLRRGILWDVFNGNEIQRVDFPELGECDHETENPYFDDDDEALMHVCFRALAGAREAREALEEIGLRRTPFDDFEYIEEEWY